MQSIIDTARNVKHRSISVSCSWLNLTSITGLSFKIVDEKVYTAVQCQTQVWYTCYLVHPIRPIFKLCIHPNIVCWFKWSKQTTIRWQYVVSAIVCKTKLGNNNRIRLPSVAVRTRHSSLYVLNNIWDNMVILSNSYFWFWYSPFTISNLCPIRTIRISWMLGIHFIEWQRINTTAMTKPNLAIAISFPRRFEWTWVVTEPFRFRIFSEKSKPLYN